MCLKLTDKFAPLVTDKKVRVFPKSAEPLGSQAEGQWLSTIPPFCIDSGVVGCIAPSEKENFQKESAKGAEEFKTDGTVENARLVCYPKLLAGIGYLSEHCDDWSFHGDHEDDIGYHSFCNAGMGPNFLGFR